MRHREIVGVHVVGDDLHLESEGLLLHRRWRFLDFLDGVVAFEMDIFLLAGLGELVSEPGVLGPLQKAIDAATNGHTNNGFSLEPDSALHTKP